jgi:hypothetical protein
MPSNLRDLLKQAVFDDQMDMTIRGTVVSVDKDALTCVVQPADEDAPVIEDVDLALGLEGVIPIPTVDSPVIVSMENGFTGFVSAYSGLDELRLIADKITFSPDPNSTSTLVVIEKLVEKMNNIENAYNALLTHYKTHFHTSGSPGSPTTPITSPFTGQNLQLTQQGDIDNPNITQ